MCKPRIAFQPLFFSKTCEFFGRNSQKTIATWRTFPTSHIIFFLPFLHLQREDNIKFTPASWFVFYNMNIYIYNMYINIYIYTFLCISDIIQIQSLNVVKSPNLPSIVSKYQESIEITKDGDVNGDVQPTPGSLTPHIRACEPP